MCRLNLVLHIPGLVHSSLAVTVSMAGACSFVPERKGKTVVMVAGSMPAHSPAAAAHCTRTGHAHSGIETGDLCCVEQTLQGPQVVVVWVQLEAGRQVQSAER